MTTAPILTTDRLTLRALSTADASLFRDFFASDHSRFYGGPVGAEQSWRKLSMYAGHWSLRGYGPWALELRGTGESVGMCGPWYPEGWPEAELTYFLRAGCAGKGYAAEALRAARDWVFGTLGWKTTMSAIRAENSASIALATRCGAVLDGQVEIVPHGMMDIYRYSPTEAA